MLYISDLLCTVHEQKAIDMKFKLKDESGQMHFLKPSIDIEDTTTSTCRGSKCLWRQLLSSY